MLELGRPGTIKQKQYMGVFRVLEGGQVSYCCRLSSTIPRHGRQVMPSLPPVLSLFSGHPAPTHDTPSSPPPPPLPPPHAITVGGLARGVDPKELAALIARALPSGASPTAEIMRDASTGVERGFGYVSVPGGEGVKAGAERAIAAYNGTRCGALCTVCFVLCVCRW